ncbi:conserved hypothetical protein [Paraburkholderia ribeironis]|uniref:Cytochrome c domain-containing protein n=1 Tax=Paraburkholderia ribeironis TaxID=1247936 RepID=A0A1N7RV87_9BURK|nr:hypothetical protein [Paraburkholderia ribeironis]SIT39030.1 conserved hypothetical protein [Paraburkholderia ribeironis]
MIGRDARSRAVRWYWSGALVVVACVWIGWQALTRWQTSVAAHDAELAQGRQLYEAAVPIRARLAGHHLDLPPAATRCANCHATAIQIGQAGFAPALTATLLTESHPRRGGPASRYDVAAFCRAVRDGLDPNSVIIDEVMPRYDMSREQCSALWVFLTQEY